MRFYFKCGSVLWNGSTPKKYAEELRELSGTFQIFWKEQFTENALEKTECLIFWLQFDTDIPYVLGETLLENTLGRNAFESTWKRIIGALFGQFLFLRTLWSQAKD